MYVETVLICLTKKHLEIVFLEWLIFFPGTNELMVWITSYSSNAIPLAVSTIDT